MAIKNSTCSTEKFKPSSNHPTSHPPKIDPSLQRNIKPTPTPSPSEDRAKKTRLMIKFDCGFNNWISIRGEGAGLDWQKGVPLKNMGTDEWVFETNSPFVNCEFKVLINDEIYESGPNHPLICGTNTKHIPYF